jgi:hypothetical protein
MICLGAATAVAMDSIVARFEALKHEFGIFAVCYGYILPFVTPFIMWELKDYNHFFKTLPYEVCEYGLPFTFVLAIMHIVVSSGQQMYTYEQVLNMSISLYKTKPEGGTSITSVVFYGLAPLNLCSIVVLFVYNVMDGRTIDSLLGLTLSVSIRAALYDGYNINLEITCLVLTLMALAIRICSLNEVVNVNMDAEDVKETELEPIDG